MSWLQDASPRSRTPRTPQRSRSQTPDPNSTFVNPSSALLQDLLKEQRATRGARANGLEELEDNIQRTPDWAQSQSRSNSQEEPGSEKQKSSKMSSSGSVRLPREMGVREADQYISKISKQNFDLKLEIFHRVQQLSVLEKKLERMGELEEELERMSGLEDEVQELRAAEEDNQRLRESNEQLRQEIDKRDQAVTEAVELICQLEARVEELETGNDISRPSTARPRSDDESGVSTPRNASMLDISTLDIPERTSSRRGTRRSERRRTSSGSRILQRAPSFLLEESKSTAALRSLYVDTDEKPVSQVTPPVNTITKSESMNSMTDTVDPESPRLSALSECSELIIDDTPITEDGYDQIDIPERPKETTVRSANLSSTTLGKSDHDLIHIDQWMATKAGRASKEDLTKRKLQRLPETSKKQPESSSPSSSFNSSSQKSRMDSIFGSTRLPPTPDTMVTAYANWEKASSNGTVAYKSQSDLRRLTRTRSADELTARRSSINSEPRVSIDSNFSKATLPRASLDDEEGDPAIYPLNSIQTRYGPSANHGLFHGDFDRVLARMDKDYYSPSRNSRDETASLGSSPPSMAPEDWIEAARPGTRNRTGPLPINSRLVGSRAPSQSSFLNRRHSIDSAVREPTLPIIQTLNLRSLETDAPQPPTEPEPEPRRKLSLLPPFFSRSGTARRLQPSLLSDPLDSDDGAPAPVVRKTRNPHPPSKLPRPLSGQNGDFLSSGPTYAEDGMSRSFTEANLFSSSFNSSTTRPSTSNGKDHHKRRGSLGIFGWMKGASAGLGSLKRSEASTLNSTGTERPVTPAPTSTSATTTVRASSRLATHDSTTPAAEQPKFLESATEELATRTRHPSRTEEPADEQGRRPRYMERRSRRA
ncbi:hypothetical protein BJY04DRAFT_207186 [Aspergillus karnatakaensis]|uniref:uncharacterized protein n=1 Tax=Aspergillus karnatakaensis TaxID=1810916 RepID=UPI003CCD76BF